MTTRTLVLGDWHPWLRDPIDVLRALLLAGAAGFALAGDAHGALLLGGAGVVAWLVRFALLPRVYSRVADKKFSSGFYVNVIFEAGPTTVDQLRHKFALNDDVFRVLFTEAPPVAEAAAK